MPRSRGIDLVPIVITFREMSARSGVHHGIDLTCIRPKNRRLMCTHLEEPKFSKCKSRRIVRSSSLNPRDAVSKPLQRVRKKRLANIMGVLRRNKLSDHPTTVLRLRCDA